MLNVDGARVLRAASDPFSKGFEFALRGGVLGSPIWWHGAQPLVEIRFTRKDAEAMLVELGKLLEKT
jgi:hypothetical protein